MKLIPALVAGVVLPLLMVGSAVAAPPPVPATPASVATIVSARPFVLDVAGRHTFRAERPAYRGGYLLVLAVDPAYVYPRQTAEPVLYVGDQTARRVNIGYRDGHVVAIVPAPLGENGQPVLDLERTRIWFGDPDLPERIDANRLALQAQRATDLGLTPRPVAETRRALRRGGALLRARDEAALTREAAALIRRYAPSERDLADGLTAPPVGPVR